MNLELTLNIEHRNRMKNIFILALPAIMEMSLNTLVGVADTLMISHFIGKEALAAVGFANQIIFMLIFIFSSFNAGATAMISRSYGEKNYQRMDKILAENLTLNLLIGTIITFVTFTFAGSILNVYEITPIVKSYGVSYLKIVSLGQFFMFITFASAAALRGAGDTRTPMLITGAANILNIIGNYFLITGSWIFPELGVAGAALSTTIARGIAAFLYIYLFWQGKRHLRLRIHLLKLSSKILKPLWKLSYAAAIEQFFMQTAFLINGIFISKLNTVSEAAFRILLNIESISFMPTIGIAIATTTLVGKHLGAKDPEESLRTGFTAAGMGALLGSAIALFYFVFPIFVLSVFTTEKEVIDASLFTIRLMALNQPFLAFMIIMTGALRGAGDTKSAMYITIMRLWLLFIPLSYFFILKTDFGVAGVWLAEITSFLVFSFVIYLRFKSMKWASIKLFEEN